MAAAVKKKKKKIEHTKRADALSVVTYHVSLPALGPLPFRQTTRVGPDNILKVHRGKQNKKEPFFPSEPPCKQKVYSSGYIKYLASNVKKLSHKRL